MGWGEGEKPDASETANQGNSLQKKPEVRPTEMGAWLIQREVPTLLQMRAPNAHGFTGPDRFHWS